MQLLDRKTFVPGLVLVWLLGSAVTCWAQRNGPPTTWNIGSATELRLLTRPDVRRELDLVDGQVTKIFALQVKMRSQMRERFAAILGAGPGRGRERAREVSAAIRQETQAELAQILLPHQLRRLRQIQLQGRLAARTPTAILTKEVAKRLEITDDQRQQLLGEQQALDAEYRRRLTELRATIRQRFVELLTPDQQKKLEELIGAPFSFDNGADISVPAAP